MKPHAVGGEATVENIELRCRAHNVYEARLFFGPDVVREEGASWGGLVPGRNELLGPYGICDSSLFRSDD